MSPMWDKFYFFVMEIGKSLLNLGDNNCAN